MMPRFFSVPLLVALPGILLLAGCSSEKKSFTQKGTVSYQGKPLSSGMVRLHMAENRVAVATIKPNGSFEATDVFPGEAKVTVEEDPAEKNRRMMPPVAGAPAPAPSVPIPPQYKNVGTTDLIFTLKSGVPLDLQLK